MESARIEFKEAWNPQASLKTICAFANDLDNWGGGYLVIGVREHDDGTKELVGVPTNKTDAWLKDMLNKCRLIQPTYTPITGVCEYGGMSFIVIWAPGGSQRPYSSPRTMGAKSERVSWIRKMASTVRPSHEEERELYNLSNNVPFDDRINHAAEVADLNPSLIKSYLREIGSTLYSQMESMDFGDLCRNMNIIEGPPEYTKLKNIGLMFFSDDPEKFFPYAHIDIVELPDGESGNRIFEHSFSGPLHHQLRDALRYLRNNIIQETVEKVDGQAEALRYFNYPYESRSHYLRCRSGSRRECGNAQSPCQQPQSRWLAAKRRVEKEGSVGCRMSENARTRTSAKYDGGEQHHSMTFFERFSGMEHDR